MRIGMLGTRGVPAQYGGFETAVEEVGKRLVAAGHEVTVYCRNPGQRVRLHLGMRLVNLPAVRRRSLETLSHTGLSVAHALRAKYDVAIVFNAGNAPFVPVLARSTPTVVHMDGIEWKRAKWQGLGRSYYQRAERAVANSGVPMIADAEGIARHLRESYDRESYVIPYGAPLMNPGSDLLSGLSLVPNGYHLVVARLEPENNTAMIVRGYVASGSDAPLVVVGSAPYQDDYVAGLRAAAGDRDVRFLGSIWDQDLLNQLYAHARSYFHGHSVGGTNPSLLRAMGCGAPVSAFDVAFNREVCRNSAQYFRNAEEVTACLAADDAGSPATSLRAEQGRNEVAERYQWDDVARRYETMLLDVANPRARSRPKQRS